MKAVRFDEYGAVDVLRVADVPDPVPGPGQVLVQVKAAGINPGEAKIREGLLHSRWPATFPSGQGSDLAGVVSAVSTGVTGIVIGPVALVGAIRLAKPGSWWAVRRYPTRPRRADRAASRYDQRRMERWNWARDLVAGAPTPENQADTAGLPPTAD